MNRQIFRSMMPKKPATSPAPTKRKLARLNSIENHAPALRTKSTYSVSVQTEGADTSSKCTNTPNYLDDMLVQGKDMNDEQFQQFAQGKPTRSNGKRKQSVSRGKICSSNRS